MSGVRSIQVPFEHVTAELAAVPLCSARALALSMTGLAPSMDGRTSALWRAAENDLLRQFPSYSIDELVAVRDWLWFQARAEAGGALRSSSATTGDGDVALGHYLRRLSASTLDFRGNVFRPSVPPWVEESSRRLAGSPDARARRFWRWVSFALPPDLLMSAHPAPGARATEIDLVSPLLSKILSDRGYVEAHMHLGAALEFGLLWVGLLHALAVPGEVDVGSFGSPGADDAEGADLSHWLIRAAIARYVTAAFLKERTRCLALTLDTYLVDYVLPMCGGGEPASRNDQGDPATRAWRDEAWERRGAHRMPGLGHRLHSALRELATGALDRRNFRMLQRTYADLTGVHRRWGKFPDTVDAALAADPIASFVTVRHDAEATPEMDWVVAGLEYLEHNRRAGRTDQAFEHVFWQTIRVRCRYYRHVVQRPMTPGLQWFVRFYRRIGVARRRMLPNLQVESAAIVCGVGHGLRSMEFRTSPGPTAQGTLQMVRDFHRASEQLGRRHSVAEPGVPGVDADAAPSGGRTRFADLRAARDQRRIGGSPSRAQAPLEVGMVLHISRDRGGGALAGRPKANARYSEADPAWGHNHGYRYAHYYREHRREAIAVARMIERFPRVLHFLRGIDLCTDELGIPMWVVAPLVRYVKEVSQAASRTLRARAGEPAPPPLATTVHAGEDFVHLLGGLRRIDESIDYLGLSQGDRIGHAIALGTEPREWATRSGGLAITKMERLLDLAWEWSFSTNHDVDVPASRVQYVMDQIERLSRDIFRQFAHPRQLADFCRLLRYEAQLRMAGFPGGPIPTEDEYIARVKTTWRGTGGRVADWGSANLRWSEDYTRGSSRRAPDPLDESGYYGHAEDPWKLLFGYLVDPVTFRRGQEQELVDPAFEADSLSALQDALRRKVGTSGITIEINPSSNLLIGNLADLQNHPLWRLRPPHGTTEARPIGVCIGSDNPITFSTNTREEYQLVYDTLTLAGLSDVDARTWIDDARNSGLESRLTLPRPEGLDLFRRIQVDVDHIVPLP